jgi:glutathione-regulated potassium-efflux system protein KefB
MNLAYLTDIIILLAAAVIAVPFSRFAGLGTVPGFLLAGVVVGPSALGLIDNVAEIGHLAELGVVLLLFIIGIRLRPGRLWHMRRLVFGLGSLQLVISGGLITAVAYYGFDTGPRTAILIGPTLALSSTALVLQLLTEQNRLTSNYGRTAIAVLLLQDLAVVPLLALASLLTFPQFSIGTDIGLALLEALAIITMVILVGRYLLQPFLHLVARHGPPEVFTASAVLLVLGSAVLTAYVGMSMAMGAFIAGLLIADSEFRHQLMAEIQPFHGLLIGLFFMSMGMSLKWQALAERPLLTAGLAAGLMAGKAALIWPLARLFGHRGWTALAVALLLAQGGEFALVLFAAGLAGGLLDEAIYQQMLVIVLLSMLVTPVMARLAYRLASPDVAGPVLGEPAEEFTAPGVIIVGFGRVGHRIGKILEGFNVPYVAVDKDAAIVREGRIHGRKLYFGDARQPEVLKGLGASRAAVVVVTIDDSLSTMQLVSALHESFPEVEIYARGHDLAGCRDLYAQGARIAVSENLEASLILAREVLKKIAGETPENETALEAFRNSYYREARASASPLEQHAERPGPD